VAVVYWNFCIVIDFISASVIGVEGAGLVLWMGSTLDASCGFFF